MIPTRRNLPSRLILTQPLSSFSVFFFLNFHKSSSIPKADFLLVLNFLFSCSAFEAGASRFSVLLQWADWATTSRRESPRGRGKQAANSQQGFKSAARTSADAGLDRTGGFKAGGLLPNLWLLMQPQDSCKLLRREHPGKITTFRNQKYPAVSNKH